MEAKTFNFELVSPEEKLISAPAHMVVIPGEEGDFGVLQGHAATISSIRPGVIEIFASANDNEPQRIFIAGGFADVTETSCTVLAEEAINVKDLNKSDLEQTIRNLNEDLSMAKDDSDLQHTERKLELAKAKLTAVTGQLVL